jgi:hypothetical protein
LEPYTDYFVYEGDDEIFRTIYPNELLIEIAQLLPDSEVQMVAMNIPVGDEMVTQGTLKSRSTTSNNIAYGVLLSSSCRDMNKYSRFP